MGEPTRGKDRGIKRRGWGGGLNSGLVLPGSVFGPAINCVRVLARFELSGGSFYFPVCPLMRLQKQNIENGLKKNS